MKAPLEEALGGGGGGGIARQVQRSRLRGEESHFGGEDGGALLLLLLLLLLFTDHECFRHLGTGEKVCLIDARAPRFSFRVVRFRSFKVFLQSNIVREKVCFYAE